MEKREILGIGGRGDDGWRRRWMFVSGLRGDLCRCRGCWRDLVWGAVVGVPVLQFLELDAEKKEA
jgi:hypothetical protein